MKALEEACRGGDSANALFWRQPFRSENSTGVALSEDQTSPQCMNKSPQVDCPCYGGFYTCSPSTRWSPCCLCVFSAEAPKILTAVFERGERRRGETEVSTK